MSRSAALLSLALAAACTKGREPGDAFRLGYFPNVTHAQALVGVADGTFSRALGHRLETRVFNAGPPAMEALAAGDLDATYVGPGPATIAFLRTHGQALVVVAGAVSGGAALVTKGIRTPQELVGKRVASPQLGNTQDVALRMWLRSHGLADERSKPNGVDVLPISSSDILSLFARGDLAGAWVPEPWAARLVHEAGGAILVDERTLWPDGRFPIAVLAVSRRALERRRPEIAALLRAHLELTRRWRADPRAFAERANEAFSKITGKTLKPQVLRDAFARIAPLEDPMPAALAKMARDTQVLGFAPEGDVSGIVDPRPLEEIAGR